MALSEVQVELTYGTSSTFLFGVDGEFNFTQDCVYKESADPPELERIEETWVITNARLFAASSELVFDSWNTFQTLLEKRTAGIIGAKIKRAGATERTLNSSTHQEFKVISVEVSGDPDSPISTFQTVVPVTIVLQAAKVFADGNGILGWEQTVSNTFRNGLHTLEWRTTIRTAEGTDARVKARTLATIPIALFGNTYTLDTNGPDGIDIEYEDADEDVTDPSVETTGDAGSSRVPTKVLAVSRIQMWGVAIGGANAGNSPNGPFSYSVEETLDEGIKRTITRASANGPSAKAWVLSKAPTKDIETKSVVEDFANRSSTGEWVTRETSSQTAVPDTVSITVGGGALDVNYAAVAGDFPPVKITGARQPFRLVMAVKLRFIGKTASQADMLLPKRLFDPWVFLQNESTEDYQPRLVKPGGDGTLNEWERNATLVYESAAEIFPDNPGPVTEFTIRSYFGNE